MNIQTKLAQRGVLLGYRIWQPKRNSSFSLRNEKLFFAYPEAVEEATHVDCIWFKGEKEMPAIIKICTKKTIIESLYRLSNLKFSLPSYFTDFVLIVPDAIVKEIKKELDKPILNNFSPKIYTFSEIELNNWAL
ncbi:MAG: hypothetical protein IPM82_16970 [Saprospiraceae bacterium]|nr:hypothetical protein [Saprospiraceae bacterium]